MAVSSTPPAPQRKRARITLGDFVAMSIFLVGMACAAATTSYFAFSNFVSIKDDIWLNSHGTLAQNPSLDVTYHRHGLPELCAR